MMKMTAFPQGSAVYCKKAKKSALGYSPKTDSVSYWGFEPQTL